MQRVFLEIYCKTKEARALYQLPGMRILARGRRLFLVLVLAPFHEQLQVAQKKKFRYHTLT